MTLISLILMFIGKKINLSDRIIIKESLNQDNFSGMVNLVKRICKYTFIFELIGALFLAIRFIPEYGTKTGIFYSIFHSISAFCNAGFDVIGNNSFISYSSDIIVNITLMTLIIVGGLGFTVWSDIFRTLRKVIREKLNIKRMWKELSLHSKIVLVTTLILLLSGTALIYGLESNNLTVMGSDSQGIKILKSAFQSTTLRTAGFSTINQEELTTAGKFISICYMFIGGSPASTSGGIKTTTFAILVLCVMNFIKGRNEINIFKKNISFEIVKRALVILAISIFIVIIAILGLLVSEISLQEDIYGTETAKYTTFSFMDVFFEAVSAFGTVGLSLNVTSGLSAMGKVIILMLMIIGRLGPITISVAIFKNGKEKNESRTSYPKGNIIVG
ncbi:MAG: hypothetical protein E7310_01505 [Clostridiales bacterium]|nr:hypothetical protein [Clostridiales bacterium]